MADPRITGISMADREEDHAAGVLARFSFDFGPVRVRGCALMLSHGGEALATLPRCRSASSAFRFVDHATRVQVSAAALVAFRALGGTLPGDPA